MKSCSALIHWDMRYGLGVADWDTLLTDSQLTLFFQQMAIINKAAHHVLTLHTHFADAGRIRKAMSDHGYQHIHPLYVYKPNQNLKGVNQFIFAVDLILVGYKSSRNDIKLTFSDPNPTMRHNMIFSHSVNSRFSVSGGDPVNITQKHPGVAAYLGQVFCTPGDLVMVIGAGSGSEVIGFNRAGMNVVGIEKDSRQFRGCCARLVQEHAENKKVMAQHALEVAQVDHLKRQASGFQHYEPDAAPNDSDSDGDDESPAVVSAATECVSCGEVLGDDVGKCDLITCEVSKVHLACLLPKPDGGPDCLHKFCSEDCASKHTCAPEAVSSSSSSSVANETE